MFEIRMYLVGLISLMILKDLYQIVTFSTVLVEF